MNPEIVAKFLENGIVGACVIVLAVVVWRLYKALTKIQETRVAEAQAVTDKLLTISSDWQESIDSLTQMVEKHNDSVVQMRTESKTTLEGFGVELRAMTKELRDYTDEMRKRASRHESRG